MSVVQQVQVHLADLAESHALTRQHKVSLGTSRAPGDLRGLHDEPIYAGLGATFDFKYLKFLALTA